MQPPSISNALAIAILAQSAMAAQIVCDRPNWPIIPNCGDVNLTFAKCRELCQCGGPGSGIGLSCFNFGTCSSTFVIEACRNTYQCHC